MTTLQQIGFQESIYAGKVRKLIGRESGTGMYLIQQIHSLLRHSITFAHDSLGQQCQHICITVNNPVDTALFTGSIRVFAIFNR